MYLNFSLKNILKSKLFILLLCIALIVIFIILNAKINIFNLGEKLSLNKIDILEEASYYAEYELTVVSNKNVNTYFVKEWWDKTRFRLELLDRVQNNIVIKGNENNIQITNSAEKNMFEGKIDKLQNSITSYSSYLKLYNENINCNCKVEVYNKDGKNYVYINKCERKNINCKVYDLLNVYSAYQVVIEINEKTNFPQQINVYDKNKNVIYGIVYTKFEIYDKFDDNLFI